VGKIRNNRNFRIIGQGKNLLKTLNTYVEIDSVEEIDNDDRF